MLKRCFFVILFSCLVWPLIGQIADYQNLKNVSFAKDNVVVFAFWQDCNGLIWLGTDKGLYSYDGFYFQSYPYDNAHQKVTFTCGAIYQNKHLYLGSKRGVYLFNIVSDRFEKKIPGLPTDVLSMILVGDKLWVGSLTGLYIYDLLDKKITNYSKLSQTGISNNAIYSLLKSNKNEMYVGTYNGLNVKREHEDAFRKIELPTESAKKSLLVISLCEDKDRKIIWIGTEGYLFYYNFETGTIEHLREFDGNSIKSLAIDKDKNILLGTDNGLFVFNPEQKFKTHLVHGTRNSNSIVDNVIFSIFVDTDQNVWFGTTNGFSFYKNNKYYQFVPISQITSKGDGNQIYCMFRDSRGNFWYGGSNGLIFVDSKSKNSIWYRMNDIRYPIPHNRVRCIYEDNEHDLWIATDGSVCHYNYERHKFQRYIIVDKTGTLNANWAYSIVEDKMGQLWIATYLGGIFVVDKKKLMADPESSYVAERNLLINVVSSLESGNFINQIAMDKHGNIWTLTDDNGIVRIDNATGKASKVLLKSSSNKEVNANSTSMLIDSEGFLWAGFEGGLNRIDPETNHKVVVTNEELGRNNIRALTDEGNYIWISTAGGIFCINKRTLKIRQMNLPDRFFMSSFYDSHNQDMFLGGVDGYIVFKPSVLRQDTGRTILHLTDLLINGKSYIADINRKEEAIHNLRRLSLPYNQNNVTFQVSDLSYSKNENLKYEYLLRGMNSEWQTIEPGTNRISYTNLTPGKYTLIVRNLSTNPDNLKQEFVFELQVRNPWYNTVWAQLGYLLVICTIVFLIIKYYRERHKGKIERIEREKSLELSNMKIAFFTNISHELKTPLSLIIAPLSKMLVETRNTTLKNQLMPVYNNALRLKELVQQVVGFNRKAQLPETEIVKSKVEFVEFAKAIFSVYEELFLQKGIKGSFNTELEQVFVEIDIVKMESVLNNLIYNAFKFTNEGGTIKLIISKDKKGNLQFSISDTGIGIPQAEIPHIFERFFQSSSTTFDNEGSGIGLYLVKHYIDQHKGNIYVESEEGKGTTITLKLPCHVSGRDMDKETMPVSIDSEPLRTNPRRKVILIVEDNLDLSNFLSQSLSENYTVYVARNGKIGFDQSFQVHPDLIIADLMMPVIDGMAMCKQLRKHKEMSLVPIIMLTAKDDIVTEEESLEAGVNLFMPKPFDLNILKLHIRRLITQNEKIEEKLRMEAIIAPKEIEATSQDEKLLADLTRIIEDNIDNLELNVDMLSELSGINTKQLYRKMKKLIGITPVDYIRSIRLKKAAMLLSQHKFSVAEVMYLVGFSNSSYFSKCFQNMFGETPKQYIEKTKPTL